ncbi:MAG: hypothetical protein IKY94_06465 [Lachnospiraceae bacterium]|nr:hypothetical protein [Clostridia bacterium]MBR4982183.1 hypothetical protein [Lachnospiraceae bacterium]
MNISDIDNWVSTHITFNSSWEQQVKDLCKFPGLENQEALVGTTLDRFFDAGSEMPYTETILDVLDRCKTNRIIAHIEQLIIDFEETNQDSGILRQLLDDIDVILDERNKL